MSRKNLIDTIRNRTRDLPACSALSQPTAPPRIGIYKYVTTYLSVDNSGFQSSVNAVLTHQTALCNFPKSKYRPYLFIRQYLVYINITLRRHYQPNPCNMPLQWHYLPYMSSSETWPFLSGFYRQQFRKFYTFLRAFYTSVRNNIRRNVEILQILIHRCLCEMWFRSPHSRHGFPAAVSFCFFTIH